MRIYNFNKVVGNYSTVAMVKSSIRTKSYPNFTMMLGESGTGKSTVAEIVALKLRCLDVKNDEPCLNCTECLNGVKALTEQGGSRYISKINMAKDSTKADVKQIIQKVFKIDSGEERVIFILEEVHTLEDAEQTALLEEVDKLSENVYVIMCTSKEKKVIEELKKRAVKFKFKQLDVNDSRILLDRIINEKQINISPRIKELILKHTKGNPRLITILTEFILKQGNISESIILDYLGEIDRIQLMILLQSYNSLQNFYQQINLLCDQYSASDILYHLKGYLLDLLFTALGTPRTYIDISSKDQKFAKELGSDKINECLKFLYNIKNDVTDVDFQIAMLKFREVIAGYKIPNAPVATQVRKANQMTEVIKEDIIEESTSSADKKADNVSINNIFKRA